MPAGVSHVLNLGSCYLNFVSLVISSRSKVFLRCFIPIVDYWLLQSCSPFAQKNTVSQNLCDLFTSNFDGCLLIVFLIYYSYLVLLLMLLQNEAVLKACAEPPSSKTSTTDAAGVAEKDGAST